LKAINFLKLSSFLALALTYSCGIKANTKPLESPVVELKRIGSKVFLRSLEGEVVPEGFIKIENYWLREQAQPFCFAVKRIEGKERTECVGGLTEERVSLDLTYYENRVRLNLKGFDTYEVYELEGERLNPWTGKKAVDGLELNRDYVKRCYLVVGKRQNAYSEPTEFCVEALPHPPIKEVERLDYRVFGDKLYLIWSYEPDNFFKEFVVLEGDKEIGTTRTHMFELKRKDKKVTYKVKVRSIYGKESDGVSLSYSP
jgi:hypothetical protein